jgi:gliding motility-associated-like protein
MNRFFLCFAFLCSANILCAQNLIYTKYLEGTTSTAIGYLDPTNCKDSTVCTIENFAGWDIAICPNGGIYISGYETSSFIPELLKIDLSNCSYSIVTQQLSQAQAACTCAKDGTLYFGSTSIWKYDTNTGVLDSIGAPPDLFLSGDLSFYNGRLIGTVNSGHIVAFDLDNIENIINLFKYDSSVYALGLVSESKSCDSTTVYMSLTNDVGTQIVGDTVNKLYVLDIPSQTLTYLCELPRGIAGLSSATEFIAQDCALVLDLNGPDNNTSSGSNYTWDSWCGVVPAPVCDSDMILYSGYRIDSVQIHLLPPLPNGSAEYLSYGTIPSFVNATGQNTDKILLGRTNGSVPNESVAANYFIEAIKSIRLNNTSVPVTPGLRTIQMVAFAKGGLIDTAFTYLTIPEVVVEIVGDSIICSNDTVVLSVDTFKDYLWSSGATSSTISIYDSGIYAITVTDINNGCTGVDTYTVNDVLPPLADWEATPPRCHNGLDGNIELLQISGGSPPFLFSLDGGTPAALQLFTGVESGVKTITIIDNKGCIWLDKVDVPNPAAVFLDIGDDLVIDVGRFAPLTPTISPTDNYTYQWLPTDYLSCNNCLSPIVTPLTDIQYYLEAINSEGCSVKDSVLVKVQIPDGNIYAPNIFTPNDDGKDDYFNVFGDPLLVEEVIKLQIYDRWGALIYEGVNLSSNDNNIGWDGTVRGKPASSGVYVWMASIRFTNGKTVQKWGDITLVR